VAYRTVNLKPQTYERLKLYQVGGASADEAIALLMDRVDPEEVFKEALRVHDRRVAAVRRRGGLSLEELKARVGERRRRAK
jgi:hypothetical protein